MKDARATAGVLPAIPVPAAQASLAGKYLYAVITGDLTLRFSSIGLNQRDIYTITEGGLSAVVSDVDPGRLRAEKRHLTAHRDVLARLMAAATPLPISFGTVAGSTEAVRKILARNQSAFLAQLERVAGAVEMGLRVVWDVPNIFEYFVNGHAELRELRDRIFGRQREPLHEDKIELGRLFEGLLQEDREICTEKVEQALGKECTEIGALIVAMNARS